MSAGDDPQRVPHFSSDGHWRWDGAAWVPADEARGVAEAFGPPQPPPPLEKAEVEKIFRSDEWGPLRLLWAVVLGKPTTAGWSGDQRTVTATSRQLVRRIFVVTVALPLLYALVSWLLSSRGG